MPDTPLNCQDCGADFLFTEAEQLLFQQRGFLHAPKRCKDCRVRQRQKGPAGGRGARGAPRQAPGPRRVRTDAGSHDPAPEPSASPQSVSSRPGFPEPSPAPAFAPSAERAPGATARPPRGPMHATSCSLCGTATEVPFRPDGVRPVFCLPCLKRQTR